MRLQAVFTDCSWQPISEKYPNFNNNGEPELQQKDSGAWWGGDFPTVTNFFRQAIQDPKCTLSAADKNKFLISGAWV